MCNIIIDKIKSFQIGLKFNPFTKVVVSLRLEWGLKIQNTKSKCSYKRFAILTSLLLQHYDHKKETF